MKKTFITDVLVIGAGGAAGRAAVEAATSGVKVDLVDKGRFGESGSSPVCLHGFATAFNKEDSPELFFEDWIRAGGYINDQNLVREAITQSQKAVEGLEAMGMEFLKNSDASRLLYRGAGHRVARGLTVKFSNVVATLRAEAERRGVGIHEGIMVTKLLQKNNQVIGAVGISQDGDFYVFGAKAVILAAGGANRLYPNVASYIVDPKYRTTGDGFYLAFSAGAPLIDMEFTQFRDSPPGAARFGGRYLNVLGERFMEKYDPQALEKAPRSRMVEAIYREIKEGRGPIMWEVEGIKEEESDFILAKQYGHQRQVEITIDFQRVLGGARINERAETPIMGLFAVGESSGGIHGGDRMQGNAFLETQVFGTNAGRNASASAMHIERRDIAIAQVDEEEARIGRISGNIDPVKITQIVQKTMWEQVGVTRDRVRLRDAIAKFEQIRREMVPRLSGDELFPALETTNLVLTAELVARAALTREETRRTQIRTDYPTTDNNNWLKHVCIQSRGKEMIVSTLPIIKRPK
jgi:succinate dehydrogenase/fumarate reductase flavoprotein subunit